MLRPPPPLPLRDSRPAGSAPSAAAGASFAGFRVLGFWGFVRVDMVSFCSFMKFYEKVLLFCDTSRNVRQGARSTKESIKEAPEPEPAGI